MPGRLAIDFGTSNTVVAVWDEARREGVPVHLPDFGRVLPSGGEEVPVVPSLIHYAADRRRWVGDQVLRADLYESPRTFVSAKFNYRVSPRTSVYLNLDNITREPVNNRYTGFSERTSIIRQLYPSVGFGVQGRF